MFNSPKKLFGEKQFKKLRTGLSVLDTLNLNRIKTKSLSGPSGYGWSKEKAHQVGEQYRIFLYLCKRYPRQFIVPTYEIDEFWHLHILDTRNYKKNCNLIFGKYLHHFPYAGLKGTFISHSCEKEMIDNTLRLVAKHFPEMVE